MFSGRLKSTKVVFILVAIIPVFYMFAQIANFSIFYAVKDIIFLILVPFFLYMRVHIYALLSILLYLLVNVYALFISLDDPLLYILSLREMLFYPVFGVLLGVFFSKHNSSRYIFYIAIAYMFFTYLYLLIYPEISFGSTNRLKSLWDREHEPAFVGAVVFFGGLFILKNKKAKVLIISLAVGLLLLSGSRSALLGLFVSVFFIYLRGASFVKLSILFATFFFTFIFFTTITYADRSVDHNLEARLNQYDLALNALVDTAFLGLGTDKYGVVSGVVNKSFCMDGDCTTTMDSSLLKYLVNYGVSYLFILIFMFYHMFTLYKRGVDNESGFLISVLIFGFVAGFFTGKLGAFPLNIFFYSSFGAIFLSIKDKSLNELR